MFVIVIIKSEMRPCSVYENDTVECIIIALAYDILSPTIAIIDVYATGLIKLSAN